MRSFRSDAPSYSWAYRRKTWWRFDLFAGVMCSLALHVAFFYGGSVFSRAKPKPIPMPDERIIQMELPPIEPEPPEKIEDAPAEGGPSPVAPPMLPDVPTTVPVDAFVQPLQPPSLGLPKCGEGLTIIPTGRGGTGNGRGIGNLFDISNLDKAPEVCARIQPAYPPEMKRRGVPGQVEIQYIIDTDGHVVALRVLSSSDRVFEAPVCEAVQRWIYKPGKKNGRAVNTQVHQTIVFNLNDY